MAGRVLVWEHQSGGDVDALGDHLVTAGLELVVVAVGDGEEIPDLSGFVALIVLGGEMDVWQEDVHPWLAAEKAAIRAWMGDRPRPLLGICLGHQLLAEALGGEVGPRDAFEVGVRPVQLTPAGMGDALLGPLGPTFPSLQWHGAEVRRVPAGAVVLATSAACAVQAMRVGPLAWGVQFHPEVGAAGADRWGADPTYRSMLDAADGPGGAERLGLRLDGARPAMAGVTAALAQGFAGVLGQRGEPVPSRER